MKTIENMAVTISGRKLTACKLRLLLRHACWVILFVCAVTPSSAHAQSTNLAFLTNGLVAYYPFNGNANDMSGYSDNGTKIGALAVADRFGNGNGAYYFNVTNLSAVVASGNNLPLGAAARTISFWAKPDRRLDSIFYRGDMLGYGNINGNAGSVICPFVWQPSPVVTLPLGSDLFQWNTSLSGWDFAKWHHFAWIMTDGAHAAFFLDGKQQVLQSYPPPLSSLNTAKGPLYIGYFTGTYFNGSIDDVRFYNRALSANETQALYQYESQPRPRLSIARAVRLDLAVEVGKRYQLETSSDLNTWTAVGSPFTATVEAFSQYADVADYNQFFRLVDVQ